MMKNYLNACSLLTPFREHRTEFDNVENKELRRNQAVDFREKLSTDTLLYSERERPFPGQHVCFCSLAPRKLRRGGFAVETSLPLVPVPTSLCMIQIQEQIRRCMRPRK